MKLKIEIRPCVGGHEAELLCEDLLDVYIRYCEKKNVSYNIRHSGKVIILYVSGALDLLAPFFNESGIHKFQRISKTEKSGRVHTSTVSVAALEKTDTVQEELYNLNDIRIDRFHCGGNGGQNVNKVETGIRLTHCPSGIVIESTSERSQKQNKDKAFELLSEKLKRQRNHMVQALENSDRYAQIKNGERSESTRVYNEKRNEIIDQNTGKRCKYKDFFKGNLGILS